MHTSTRFAALVACVALAIPALAQTPDRATAEALFRAGRDASDAGDAALACRRFQESYRLDPTVGTLFNLGDCREKLGELATAWQAFMEVAERLPPADERAPIARARATALEPRLPRLVLHLEPASATQVRVVHNGRELTEGSLDVALPVDPGAQVLIVRAPNHRDATHEVMAVEGQTTTITLELGPPLPSVASSTPAGAETPAERPQGRGRTIGIVVAGVGAGGIMGSLVLGKLALERKSDVAEHCEGNRCTTRGLDAADEGRRFATASTIVGAVGLGAMAVGSFIVLRSRAGKTTALAPRVTNDGAELSWGGTF